MELEGILNTEGNTPTGVGKTLCRHYKKLTCRKHPHGCGEDEMETLRLDAQPETPPRVWGRPPKNRIWLRGFGNTPTGVGKTFWWSGHLWQEGKHPHGCGEDQHGAGGSPGGEETPPRVWGRPLISLCNPSASQKHPHGCGEDSLRPGINRCIPETPPRVWGRLTDPKKRSNF